MCAELDREDATVTNYFTRGLLHSRGKPDLQIREPVDPFMAVAILREMVERMDRGLEIYPGQRLEDVVPDVVLSIAESADKTDMLTISLSEASLAD